MKKILFVFSMIMSVVNASAQFVTYEPVYVPQQSYTPSAGYGTPFNVYEPVYVDSYQRQQQQRKQYSIITRTALLRAMSFSLKGLKLLGSLCWSGQGKS